MLQLDENALCDDYVVFLLIFIDINQLTVNR